MPKTCVSCKTVSETGEGYHEGSFQPGQYCPLCYRKRRVAGGKWTLILLGSCMGFLWLLTFTKGRDHSPLWVMLNIYLMIFFQYLVILPHELGHAVSARLMGLKIFRVSVGIGAPLWRGSLLGGRFEINRYPIGGYTLSLDNRERGFRLRHWIHVACGPLVNGLLVLAALPFLARPVQMNTLGGAWDPVKAFIGANLLILTLNLIPRRTQTIFGPVKTDGLRLVSTPFMPQHEVRQALSLWYHAPAGLALEERRNEEAIRLLKEGIQAFPEILNLRHDLAVALLRVDQCDEARRELLSLLENPKFEPKFRAFCLNNIAAADIILGRPELLEEADRTSTEAMTSMAWNPIIKGCRAAVLVELGRLEEGIALARQTLDLHEDEKAKAWSAVTLAGALKRKGDEAEGRKYFELAVRVGADGPRMERIRGLYAAPP